jgi:ribosomal protein S18 acetylase RimI-like enzyme
MPDRRPLACDRRAATFERLQRQLLHALARGAERIDTGSFMIHLWPTRDPYYRTVALPVRPAADWGRAIAAMCEAFAEAGRLPRLELIAEAWPDLPPALEALGFVREVEAPVMILEEPPWGTGDSTAPVVMLEAAFGAGLLRKFLERQSAAFGATEAVEEHEVKDLARALGEGATLAAAVIERCEPVAGASLIGVGREAELAGVWTARERRRQGLATRTCRRLLQAFFARGGELVWLSAAGQGSDALYRRLGFRAVGVQLNYRLPAGVVVSAECRDRTIRAHATPQTPDPGR